MSNILCGMYLKEYHPIVSIWYHVQYLVRYVSKGIPSHGQYPISIPANPSAFCGIFPHLIYVFHIPLSCQSITESQILQSKIYSHQMVVKSLIQATLSPPKDELLYCQWFLSVRDRKKEIETGDRQVNTTRERGSLWRLFRENSKTFLNGILGRLQSTNCDATGEKGT